MENDIQNYLQTVMFRVTPSSFPTAFSHAETLPKGNSQSGNFSNVKFP